VIVYSSTLEGFKSDVLSNDIGNIILQKYKEITGRNTGESEIQSWTNSLQYMDRVLCGPDIESDVNISIEYHIPQSSKRIDFIVSGQNHQREDTAVLIELKQWQEASITELDGVVRTRFKNGETDTAHPSYQAWSYKMLLEDFNQTVEEDSINLVPCAYLHNYEPDDVIVNDFYKDYTQQAPVFLKPDAIKLREFISKHVKYADKNNVMYRIDNGKIRPSKSLADQLSSMLSGNAEFTMIDDQKVVYEKALELARLAQSGSRQVMIVEGGPGTGKSVLAINLLVKLTELQLNTQYVTRNSAPREVYHAKLVGSFKQSHIKNLFSGSGTYHSVDNGTFDALIVDEAHRLNEKSGMFSHLGENQIKEIIEAAYFSIFFVDENQKVTLKDVGDTETILQWSNKLGARSTVLELASQFRCNGSDGYLAWIDDALQLRETANKFVSELDYDFQVIDSPAELHDLIKSKNDKNKARLVAGYCWKWVSKKNPELKDITIGDYEATWNLDSDGQAWIIKPESVSEVGCIHTSQGLEVDYVGVIIGDDFIVRNGKVITQPENRASTDKSVHGWKKLMNEEPELTKIRLDMIIKNTYRTLMTRGQKGCYIYCTDKETQDYFKSLLSK
jgi:uncharacterized protein